MLAQHGAISAVRTGDSAGLEIRAVLGWRFEKFSQTPPVLNLEPGHGGPGTAHLGPDECERCPCRFRPIEASIWGLARSTSSTVLHVGAPFTGGKIAFDYDSREDPIRAGPAVALSFSCIYTRAVRRAPHILLHPHPLASFLFPLAASLRLSQQGARARSLSLS